MRTVPVRFADAEHRVLSDLAAAQGVSVEALVRDALGLVAIDLQSGFAPRLRVVPDSAVALRDGVRDDTAPVG